AGGGAAAFSGHQTGCPAALELWPGRCPVPVAAGRLAGALAAVVAPGADALVCIAGAWRGNRAGRLAAQRCECRCAGGRRAALPAFSAPGPAALVVAGGFCSLASPGVSIAWPVAAAGALGAAPAAGGADRT